MTMTFEYDLDSVKVNHRAKYIYNVSQKCDFLSRYDCDTHESIIRFWQFLVQMLQRKYAVKRTFVFHFT